MSDRSKDYLDGMRDGMTYREDHFKKLEAEIERLRAALREINRLDDSRDLPDARAIASAALEGKP